MVDGVIAGRAKKKKKLKRKLRKELQPNFGRKVLRKWLGRTPQYIPLIFLDRRYWEARLCGWDALTGRTDDGIPCEPFAPWWTWWTELDGRHRREIIKQSRQFWALVRVRDLTGREKAKRAGISFSDEQGGGWMLRSTTPEVEVGTKWGVLDILIGKENQVAAAAIVSAYGGQPIPAPATKVYLAGMVTTRQMRRAALREKREAAEFKRRTAPVA